MFRVILLCLLTCCSSFMPLKQSESIISEDYTHVVEHKTKRNVLDHNGMVFVISFNDLLSEYGVLYIRDYFTGIYGSLSVGRTFQVNFEDELTSDRELIYYDQLDYDVLRHTPSRAKVVQINYVLTNTTKYDLDTITFYYIDTANNQHNLVLNRYTWHNDNYDFGDVSGYVSTNIITNTGTFNFALMGILYNRDSKLYDIFGEFSAPNFEYNNGYQLGYQSGSISGYRNGYTDGSQVATDAAKQQGYQEGYNAGVSDTIAGGSEVMTIFAGIMDVAFIPVNVFFLMFDYEVFGINIAGFVSGLLTIAIVIILMRFIFGRKV